MKMIENLRTTSLSLDKGTLPEKKIKQGKEKKKKTLQSQCVKDYESPRKEGKKKAK